MPTVLRLRGYRFFFFSNERNEPPHIHVQKAENYPKFWLTPVELAANRGIRSSELGEIRGMIQQNRDQLLAAWHAHFPSPI